MELTAILIFETMQFDVHPFIEGYVDAILTEESLFAAAMKKVKLSRRCLLHSRKGTKIIDQIVDNFLLKSHAQLVDSVSFQFSKWVGEMYASPIIPRFSITEPKCSLEENEHRIQEKKKLVLKLSEGYSNSRLKVTGLLIH